MSDRNEPHGPPWALDVVADVHAGVYPPDVTERLRALMAEDPEASSMLAALDGVVDDLSLLPAPTMPAEYAARLDAALLAEVAHRDGARPTATVTPLRAVGPAPTGAAGPVPPAGLPAGVADLDRARNRRRGWFAGIGAVAAAAVIGTVVVINLPSGDVGGPSAAAPPVAAENSPSRLFKYAVILDDGLARTVPVQDRLGCLEALDLSADSVLTVADGRLSGEPVTLVVTEDLGDAPADADRVRLVVVAQGCSADGADIVTERLTDR